LLDRIALFSCLSYKEDDLFGEERNGKAGHLKKLLYTDTKERQGYWGLGSQTHWFNWIGNIAINAIFLKGTYYETTPFPWFGVFFWVSGAPTRMQTLKKV
jgi:hypothetical protein